jgi:hypothetical protein
LSLCELWSVAIVAAEIIQTTVTSLALQGNRVDFYQRTAIARPTIFGMFTSISLALRMQPTYARNYEKLDQSAR